MIQQDYLLKQIEELGKVISELISLRKSGKTNRQIDCIENFYELINLNKSIIDKNTPEEIINNISRSYASNYLDILELISSLLFEESFIISDKTDRKACLNKANKLLLHVNSKSRCFSFQRQQMFIEIANQLNS